MKINDIPVLNRNTVRDVTAGKLYPSSEEVRRGAQIALDIGILDNDSSKLVRLRLWVPVKSLMQSGRNYRFDNTRLVRMNHFMNIIDTLAAQRFYVDFERESVVFLGFTDRYADAEGHLLNPHPTDDD